MRKNDDLIMHLRIPRKLHEPFSTRAEETGIKKADVVRLLISAFVRGDIHIGAAGNQPATNLGDMLK